MTGFGNRSMKRKISCPRDAVALPLIGFIRASSAMSAPATNAFSPPPVTMTAFTLSSARAALKALSISATVCALSAFKTFGRSIVTIRTPSRFSVLTLSIFADLSQTRMSAPHSVGKDIPVWLIAYRMRSASRPSSRRSRRRSFARSVPPAPSCAASPAMRIASRDTRQTSRG